LSPVVELRPIAPEDLEFLRAVYASTRAEELAQTAWSESERAVFLAAQFEAQHRYYQENYRGAAFDVVLVEGRPAGRLYVARGTDEIRVIDISLLPEFRRRGIGGQLLDELLREASAQELPVRVHVERFNPALRFYDRLGFRLLADRGVYLFLERPPLARGARPGP
jgi:ribosomal protein S18 acetylase RimI-like enzyme